MQNFHSPAKSLAQPCAGGTDPYARIIAHAATLFRRPQAGRLRILKVYSSCLALVGTLGTSHLESHEWLQPYDIDKIFIP
jgi:hypothetical protein